MRSHLQNKPLDTNVNVETFSALLDQYRINDQTNFLTYLLYQVMINEGIKIALPEAQVRDYIVDLRNMKDHSFIYIPELQEVLIPGFTDVELEAIQQALTFLKRPAKTYVVGSSINVASDYFFASIYPKMKAVLAEMAAQAPHLLLPFQRKSRELIDTLALVRLGDLIEPILELSVTTTTDLHSMLDDAFNIALQLSQIISRRREGEDKQDKLRFLVEKNTNEISLDFIKKMENLRKRTQALVDDLANISKIPQTIAKAMLGIDAELQKYAIYQQTQALVASADFTQQLISLLSPLPEGQGSQELAAIFCQHAGIKPADEHQHAAFHQNKDDPEHFQLDIQNLTRAECEQLLTWLHAECDLTAKFNPAYEQALAVNGRGHYKLYNDGKFVEDKLMPERYLLDIRSEVLFNTILPLLQHDLEKEHTDSLQAHSHHAPESPVTPLANNGTLFRKTIIERKNLLAGVSNLDSEDIRKQRGTLSKSNQ